MSNNMTDLDFINYMIKRADEKLNEHTWSLAVADTKAAWGDIKGLAEAYLRSKSHA
jgi:hypothetical protein